MGRKAVEMTGRRFGRVLVLSRAGLASCAATWSCLCDCGVRFVAFGGNLRKGDTTSCGCFRAEVTGARSFKHGHSGYTLSATYRVWTNMLSRCYNPRASKWADYGGRGIAVCELWHSFENFLADMGPRPDTLTLERSDNEAGYSKANCRWATRVEQARNKRNNKLLEHAGRTQPVSAWAEEAGMSQDTLGARVLRGWSVARAITEPVRGAA